MNDSLPDRAGHGSRRPMPRLGDDLKERVREAYPIDRAVEDFSGTVFIDPPGSPVRRALCPFHKERTPSFNVWPEEGTFKCFGAGCGASGDVFSFIMQSSGARFPEALRLAAERVGLEPTPSAARARAPQPSRPPAKRRPAEPRELGDCDLAVVPDRAARPTAGRLFEAWRPGRGTVRGEASRCRPTMVHEYRDVDGGLRLCVVRIERPGGRGKVFLPFRLGELPPEAPNRLVVVPETRMGWLLKGPSRGVRRPVYGIDRARRWIATGGRWMLVVEGEKTCDAARRLLAQTGRQDTWLAVSPLGGAGGAMLADWNGMLEALVQAGVESLDVVVWPDGDHPTKLADGDLLDPQERYARDVVGGLAGAMKKAGMDPAASRFRRVPAPLGAEHGWDLADAEARGRDGKFVADRIGGDCEEISLPGLDRR